MKNVDVTFEEKGKVGIKDVAGQVVVPALYDDWVLLFGRANRPKALPMLLAGQIVFVKSDGSGDLLLKTDYEWIEDLAFSLYYIVGKDGKRGHISKSQLTPTLECIYDEISLDNGVILLREGDKWGFYFQGTLVKPIFDELGIIEIDEYISVRMGDSWGYVTESGGFTVDDEYAYWVVDLDLPCSYEESTYQEEYLSSSPNHSINQ